MENAGLIHAIISTNVYERAVYYISSIGIVYYVLYKFDGSKNQYIALVQVSHTVLHRKIDT